MQKVFVLLIQDCENISVDVFSDKYQAQLAASAYCEECWDPAWGSTEEFDVSDMIQYYQENTGAKITIIERTINVDSQSYV